MQAATAMKDIARHANLWDRLRKGGAFAVSILAGFLIPPPTSNGTSSETFWNMGKFAAIAVFATLTVGAQVLWQWEARRWLRVGIASFVVGFALTLAYIGLRESLVCHARDVDFVVGMNYTQYGRAFISKDPDASCNRMLDEFAGRADLIWTHRSIVASRIILLTFYTLCIPPFTLGMFGVAQAYHLGQEAMKKARGQKPLSSKAG